MDGGTPIPAAPSVSLTDDDLERALDNWGRWCREHKIIGECESIEHLYRSPQHWHEPPPPQAWKPPISRPAALTVNRAWLVVPQPYKRVVADWYVFHRNPSQTLPTLRIIRRSDKVGRERILELHAVYLDHGRTMVRNQLTRQNGVGITLTLLQYLTVDPASNSA